MPQTRSTFCWRAVGCRTSWLHEQVRHVDDAELLELVELEVRELLSKYDFRRHDSDVKGAAKLAGGDKGELGSSHHEAGRSAGQLHTAAERAIDQPFLMPIEDVFRYRARHVVTGGGGHREGGDEIEIVV